jgi:nucleoside-diphosphate-sugar epimerase
MRVFVAGATGAIGKQLVSRLVAAGHEVHGMTRSESKKAVLGELGAVPVVADALDPDQVAEAMGRATPDAIVHELTAIGPVDMRHFDRDFSLTNRLRTEGADHLLSAGQAVGVRRFVAQSHILAYARTGGPIKTEQDPVDSAPAGQMRASRAAIRHLEEAVLGARTEGIVLRYGVPRWVGRLFAGEAGLVMIPSFAARPTPRPKRELGWRPAHPSWRQGIAAA